jgi:hypothetical protein
MRKILIATAAVAATGAALAQINASSSVYFLEIDPARYGGPDGQRIAIQVDDQPRHVALGAHDEICVRLMRASTDGAAINAQVRALRPEPQAAAVVQVAGPDIKPGTYRSTPWGMLLRVVADSPPGEQVKATADAPVCAL